jgi:23S rRNA pseudouridine1911/1915/1917 synthase
MGDKIRVTNLSDQCRLDVFLSGKLGISRNRIQGLIEEGKILLNAGKVKKNIKIKEGDLIEVTAPLIPEQKINAENIPLDVIYQDDDIIVLNKIAGMIVHPTTKIKSGTLVNALLFHFKVLSDIGGIERSGLVHRLDRDTSGVLVAAKTNPVHTFLSQQFKNREVKKKYIALVHGEVKKEENIETFFGRHPRAREKMSTWGGFDTGKKAITEIKIIEKFKDATLLEVHPRTGRTHQIRVHLAYIGHPVLGDKVYIESSKLKAQSLKLTVSRHMLHAQSIRFLHPGTGKYAEFSVPIPEDMQRIIDNVRS